MLRTLFVLLFLFILFQVKGQSEYQMKGNDKKVEIDFLSSYYSQDGNNAAVTGGIGTEELTDISSMIIINVPIDSTKSINFSGGADYYTSASTDNIDNNKSSASSKDVRAYANLGYNWKQLEKGNTFGVRVGFSNEYDYTSINGGLSFAKEFNEGNSEISLNGQAFFDNWKPYLPVELRGVEEVSTTSRTSYNAQLTFSQVINRRLQMAISAEAIYMQGLLSTPFHRVYLNLVDRAVLEKLPDARLKLPFSVRATYYATDRVVLRGYYRFYTDDFGINGHTVSLDVPVKVSDSWTVTPFYRFHTQTAADYFAPFASHGPDKEFYTSDYDLSELSSNKYGLGVEYNPVYGLARAKLPFGKNVFVLKSIELRGSAYRRDTGLTAFAISLGLKMQF